MEIANDLKVWCILIPTLMEGNFVRTRHHKVFDAYVRKITGGITIFAPGKGQWINPENDELVEERIIPVNIACNDDDLKKIVNFTIKHYKQDALMYYKVSDEVFIMAKDEI
jgi:hypothetical protein